MSVRDGCGILLAVLAAALLSQGAFAQTQAPPCKTPEHGLFDFWIGEWEVRWSAFDGSSGIGGNKVTRDYGGCVVTERYQDRTTDFAGTSILSFQPRQGRWIQSWMDNRGLAFQALGGRLDGGTIEMQVVRTTEAQPEFRIRFEEIAPDSFTWRFQTKKAEAWSDMTVSRYRRTNSAAGAKP